MSRSSFNFFFHYFYDFEIFTHLYVKLGGPRVAFVTVNRINILFRKNCNTVAYISIKSMYKHTVKNKENY